FDCDSTLTAMEGIDWLAQNKGCSDKVEVLTAQAMGGKIKFEEVFARRLALIQPTLQDLELLAERYIANQLKDVASVIEKLQSLGKNVFIVSGGYSLAVKHLAQNLNIPAENVFAVDLFFNPNGNYLGFDDKNPLTRSGGKKTVIEKIVTTGSTIFVGDGFTDLEAKNAVDLFIGFGGVIIRPIVQQEADIFIKIKSLMPVLFLACGNLISEPKDTLKIC
ncbi:MAG: HAD-IB family phosphatase, partial [Candidatus Gribaldobacteria bacterium]|nr:HAD-IB family phosphatase [Candidatus Gribaldobacteria bacterium]